MLARARLVLVFVLVVAAASVFAAQANAKVVWLCKPGMAKDPCTPSLKTTVFHPFDTKVGVITPKRVANPKIDCFYVYPTVSNQQTTNATKARDPEIQDIALYQTARYSQVCRVFAPIYRQITVPALERGDFTAANQKIGQGDVLEAWKQYLAKYNKGRGVVLIGHSQGSFVLTDLIAHHIDNSAKMRRKIVSAILLGGNVTERKHSDRGGSFKNMAACRKRAQTGCVIAFSSFNDTPPDTTLFGHTGLAGQEVMCTNPAALGGGSAKLDSIIPSKPFAPGTLIAAGIQLLDFPIPQASTPFVESHGAFSGRCTNDGKSNVLRVTSEAGTPVPKASPDATWGLHLIDANVALGDLVDLVKAQAAAFAR